VIGAQSGLRRAKRTLGDAGCLQPVAMARDEALDDDAPARFYRGERIRRNAAAHLVEAAATPQGRLAQASAHDNKTDRLRTCPPWDRTAESATRRQAASGVLAHDVAGPLDRLAIALLTSASAQGRRRILRSRSQTLEDAMKSISRALVALTLSLMAGTAFAAWPERPITLIVPWGAGGGTDAVARFFGAYLEKELKQPVNVVNRTGGNGVVGHSAIAQASPDGYTIGLITVEITMMHWQGLTELGPTSYQPLALVNADPAGFQVRADSPWKTVEDVIADVKANPGKHKASGTGQGGIWQLAIAGLLGDLKVDPNAVPWVPSNGAAPGLQDLVAGGVDIVPCSIPEARALIDAGKVKSLAIFADKAPALYPNLPTIKQATGSDWKTAAWRGFAAPKGLPKDIADKLTATMKKAYDSKEYKDFLAQRGFGGEWGDQAGFASYMAKGDADMGKVMKAVGLAK
jgi:tripartite-type tricarboxylate transporter receptor subunit TctC